MAVPNFHFIYLFFYNKVKNNNYIFVENTKSDLTMVHQSIMQNRISKLKEYVGPWVNDKIDWRMKCPLVYNLCLNRESRVFCAAHVV